MKAYIRTCSISTISSRIAARVLMMCSLLLYSAFSAAVSTNQLDVLVDNFSDGTLQNWAMGQSAVTLASMSNQSSGGPAGVADNYLRVVSDSTASAGSHKMTFFNKGQWQGDYLAAGITAIHMDLNNFTSSETLNLRLAIYGGFSDPNDASIFHGGLFATTASISLDSGSGWSHVVFSLLPADLTAVSGRSGVTGNDAMITLSNVLELRVLNSATPDWTGGAVSATLGVDHISALVSLPSAIVLFGSGLLGLGFIVRRGIFRH